MSRRHDGVARSLEVVRTGTLTGGAFSSYSVQFTSLSRGLLGGSVINQVVGVMYAMLEKYWRRSKLVKSSDKKKNNANECEVSKRRRRSSRVSGACVSVMVSAENASEKRRQKRGDLTMLDGCGLLILAAVWMSEGCEQSSQ